MKTSLPFLGSRAYESLGNMEPITSRQIDYIHRLVERKNQYKLSREFEVLLERPMNEWLVGEASFLIQVLMGRIKPLPLCQRCHNEYADYHIVTTEYGVEDKTTDVWICKTCRSVEEQPWTG